MPSPRRAGGPSTELLLGGEVALAELVASHVLRSAGGCRLSSSVSAVGRIDSEHRC